MDINHNKKRGLSRFNDAIKLVSDITLAIIGLSLTWWIIIIAAVLAGFDTRLNGFFTQIRVGKNGKLFKVIKIRTMKIDNGISTTVTTGNDSRITRLGSILRKTKIDELPQLINVLLGQMSFVGPRPDVPGYLDSLEGEDRIILTLRPGITGPATLYYRNEEELLSQQKDPEKYNREIIFPHKVKINKEYVLNYSFWKDLHYIYKTVIG